MSAHRTPKNHSPGAMLAAVALAVLSIFAAGSASSQPRDPDKPLPLQIVWGFSTGGVGQYTELPGYRFAPARIVVGPVDEALAGVITIEHPQDKSQRAVQTVPFATTPGRMTFIDTCVAMPTGTDRISVVARDDRGRDLARLTYAHAAPTALSPPNVNSMQAARFLTLGVEPKGGLAGGPIEVTGNPSHPVRNWRVAESRARDRWAESPAHAARPRPMLGSAPMLPIAWVGYEGMTAVIVAAGELASIAQTQRAALATWIEAGGVLVVVANAPGDEWRLAPTPEPLDRFIAFGESDEIAVPAMTLSRGGESVTLPGRSALARPLRLTPAARAAGWTTRWPLDPDGVGAGGSLVAEGPVGTGRVIVMGLNPDVAAEGATDEASAKDLDHLWYAAISGLAEETDRHPIDRNQRGPRFGWGGWDEHGAENDAVRSAINDVLIATPVGTVPFVVVALAFGAMAIFVSLIDPLMLKRFGLRHRAWLIGLGWIFCFSCVLGLLPIVLREGRSEFGRFGLTDVVLDEDGSIIAAARTGITTIYAGDTASIGLGPQPAGVWIRGVEPGGYRYDPYARASLPPLRIVRASLPGPAGQTPTGLLGPRGMRAEGGPVATVSQGVWTLRALVDLDPMLDGRAANLPRAELHMRDGTISMTIHGVPRGWSVRGWLERPGTRRTQKFPAPLASDGSEITFDLPAQQPIEDREFGFGTLSSGLPMGLARRQSLVARAEHADRVIVFVEMRGDQDADAAAWDWVEPAGASSTKPPRIARTELVRFSVPAPPRPSTPAEAHP